MIYDCDYFIKKYRAIPEKLWCTGALAKEDGTACAFGHCDRVMGGESVEGNRLWLLTKDYFEVALVNDGSDERYKQSTPKQRILAALRDIKKMQESSKMLNSGQEDAVCDTTKPIVVQEFGQYKNISKQIAVLPVDEKSDVKIIPEKIK